MHAQKVPFEVRNFLLDFEKVVDLGDFDTALLTNQFSTAAAEKFTNFFINKEILIYNDIAQVKGAATYINPGDYVKKVSELYPIGLSVYISDTKILDVKEYSTYSLYVVEIQKTMLIDNMLQNRPEQHFQTPVRLIMYIIRYTENSGIKITGIEAAGNAINNKTTYNGFQPDRIELNYHYNAYNLNFKDIPEQYSGQDGSGHQNRIGLLLDWDLSGKKNLTYGLATGLFYDKTKFSTELASYTDRPIPMTDKDGLNYKKLISGTDIQQDNTMSQLTIPVYFTLRYELNPHWKKMDIKQTSSKSLAYRRGVSFNFRIGPHFQYHVSDASDPYTGTFNYSGQYRFFNPLTSDSSTVIISDLPEYGFTSDTTFSSSNPNLNYQKFNFGISTQLNVSFPIFRYLDFYIGPSLFFNLSNLAETSDDFVLSREIGENNSLASGAKSSAVAYGFNAGLVLNLHAPRVPYSSVNMPEKAKNQFKAKTAYTLEKGSLMKMALNVNVRNESNLMNKKVRIPYEITTDWHKHPAKGSFTGNKTHILKYDFPQSTGNLNFKSSMLIEKPFGYDVKCADSIAINNVNQPSLTISLESLNKLVGSRQPLDLTVSKLPTFNFIYISLYNVNETMEQRKSIVGLVRQIGNEAIYNQEELLVYLSSEAGKPIAYCNFLSSTEDLPDNIVTDWDRFLYKLEEEYNSQDLIYEDDIKNIDQILNPMMNLDERANAERRYVKYSFIVNESDKYYGIDPEVQSDIRSLIYFMSNKYCAKIPFRADQYSFNVYLTEKYKNERKSPSDININIEHINK